VPLYLGGVVPPSFPNGGCVPLNSGGFVPPNSRRILPLSPLEDASSSILGGTVPAPTAWEGQVPLNSRIMCPRHLCRTH